MLLDDSKLGESLALVSEYVTLDREEMRRLFDFFLTEMRDRGFPAEYVLLDAKGWNAKRRLLKRCNIDRFDFSKIKAFYLSARTANDLVSSSTLRDRSTAMGVVAPPRCGFEIWPSAFGISQPRSLQFLHCIGRKVVQSYGYIFVAPSGCDALGTVHIPSIKSTASEEAENHGFWQTYQSAVCYVGAVLRDIHQVMFLSRPYLDLLVEGTTLEKWVKKDDARGTLRKLNDKITVWTPPPDQIGVIRERLFLSGNLFYHRFFQTGEPDNPWARDFSKPFKPKEVPEIFRADYRRVIDPPVG